MGREFKCRMEKSARNIEKAWVGYRVGAGRKLSIRKSLDAGSGGQEEETEDRRQESGGGMMAAKNTKRHKKGGGGERQ